MSKGMRTIRKSSGQPHFEMRSLQKVVIRWTTRVQTFSLYHEPWAWPGECVCDSGPSGSDCDDVSLFATLCQTVTCVSVTVCLSCL